MIRHNDAPYPYATILTAQRHKHTIGDHGAPTPASLSGSLRNLIENSTLSWPAGTRQLEGPNPALYATRHLTPNSAKCRTLYRGRGKEINHEFSSKSMEWNDSPKNNTRPHRNPREYLQRQRSAPAQGVIVTGIGAPTALPVQQARETASAVRDGEEGDEDIDDEVDGQRSGRLAATEATEIVGGEEEGEDGLYTHTHIYEYMNTRIMYQEREERRRNA